MAANSNEGTINPLGLGRTLLGVTIFFAVATAFIISLRCWVRIRHKVFGIDDGLMVVGWVGE